MEGNAVPLPYIALHLGLCALGWLCATHLPARFNLLLALFMLGGVCVNLLFERRPDLAWRSMNGALPDLIFLTNGSLETATVFSALLWRMAQDRGAKVRATFLSTFITSAACWSYGWYFMPLPAGLSGRVDSTGYCRQTTDDSCSAASAVMLLHRHGIVADEAEMAFLCLTRAGQGTWALGLYHGLAVKAASRDLRPVLVSLSNPSQFHALGQAAIINVNIRPGTPSATAKRLEGYGWQFNQGHTLVVEDADPAGTWIKVADPSYGRERWPTKDLEYLWDGTALILRK